jgi:hypothetical protein
MNKLKKGQVAYLAGPMTGRAGFNLHVFDYYTNKLREMGLHVVSPAETLGGETRLDYATYMAIDVGYIQAVEAVVLMPGWFNSRGANLEAGLAHALGKGLYEIVVHSESELRFRRVNISGVYVKWDKQDAREHDKQEPHTLEENDG